LIGRTLSIILLPTLECNVTCDYCFEEKSKISLPLEQVPLLTEHLIEHMQSKKSVEANLYWQGGEVMLLGPTWFERAGEIMGELSKQAGVTFRHYLQTNLIGWNDRWNPVVHQMFGSSLGTSMDYPNAHRRLKNGSTEQYTKVWLKAVRAAQADDISVGVIAVLQPESLEAGAEDFFRFFTETAGISDFQVNMPFPGGPNEGQGTLDCEPLSVFLVDLLHVWLEKGQEQGVKLGPFSELMDQFSGRQAQLPCIWQPNCANEFLTVDARGTTALCDCWVTSYPQHSFGNVFLGKPKLSEMLGASKARERFLERPKHLIQNEECRTCEWLSMCHGGCPVRTYTAKGTIFAKDPYCEVYKAIFSETRKQGKLAFETSCS
jgi:radical SAM protein with 4Fe4S-binding SPASM domain